MILHSVFVDISLAIFINENNYICYIMLFKYLSAKTQTWQGADYFAQSTLAIPTFIN